MQKSFLTGVAAGFFIMVLSGFIAAPACTFIGACVAGAISPGNRVPAGILAGIATGILGIVFALATYFLNLVSLFGQMWGVIMSLGMPSVLMSMGIFFLIPGILGGTLGGFVQRYIARKTKRFPGPE